MAEVHKERGNTAFKLGKHQVAAAAYSDGIRALKHAGPTAASQELMLACYLNRAAVYLKQSLHTMAARDCVAALEIDPESTKGLFRHAQVRRALCCSRAAARAVARGQRPSLSLSHLALPALKPAIPRVRATRSRGQRTLSARARPPYRRCKNWGSCRRRARTPCAPSRWLQSRKPWPIC